ncbi:MAG TPA: phosphoribosylanthranilate isomerase [Selenomonadales bacterium]|nr:phosphoribosylanthranilate isomerase [Selenomonadales bacterium]
MIVKICGIATLSAAQAARDAGADFLGLVFADSRRRVTAETARRLAAAAKGLAKVGVFVNAPLAELRDIARSCRLDYVQLHGDESPEYCRQVGYPVIKAVRMDQVLDVAAVARYPVDWLLVDSFVPGRYGGTGKTFDWAAARGRLGGLNAPVIVAGGLTPENVGEAIAVLTPQGVDVSGGVETDGAKDSEKIYRFIAEARQAGGGITCSNA